MPELLPDGSRKVWNPFARYYIEPAGEWVAEKIKSSSITPNMITIFNTIISSLATVLILLGGQLNLILFGIYVRFFHFFDIIDGHLARIRKAKSDYGGFIDAVGDRVVMGIWSAAIIYYLYISTSNSIYIIWGLIFLFGLYMYMSTAGFTDRYYPGHMKEDTMKAGVKKNFSVWLFLAWIEPDIQYHFLTFAAIFNRLDLYIFFYAAYFNLLWLAYVGYYSVKWIRKNSVE